MKTIIIGLGNPILSDDGAGIAAARLLRQRVEGMEDVDVVELHAGGLRIADAVAGYDRAMLIDATRFGDCRPGTIRSLSPADCATARHMACSHDADLPTALEAAALLGVAMPQVINIWGIEAGDMETFGEELTGQVRKAVPLVVEQVMKELRRKG